VQISPLILALAVGAVADAQDKPPSLTVKQAEALALNAPLTSQAACCPHADGVAVKAGSTGALYTLIWVQVRCTCTEYAGKLIDNYTVNPKTGQIWEGFEDTGKPLTSKRLDAVRRASFLELRRSRAK